MDEGHQPEVRRARRRNGGVLGARESEARQFSAAMDILAVSDILSSLRRRWWLVAIAVTLGLGGAYVVVSRELPQYRANVALRLGGYREAFTTGMETPTQWDRFADPLLSQMQLIRSRSLIGEVVDSVGYRLRPDYRGLHPSLLKSVYVAESATADSLWFLFGEESYSVRTRGLTRHVDYGDLVEIEGIQLTIAGQPATNRTVWTVSNPQAAIDRLLADLRVAPRSETDIVDVSFTHPDPVTAQRIVNMLAERHQEFEARFAQDRSHRRRVFLEEQLEQTDASLASAQRALSDFQTRVQTYDARQELSAQRQNRFTLDIRREELDAERRMFQVLLNRLDSASADADRWEVLRTLVSAPGIADNPVVALIHQQLLGHRAVLDSLTTGEFGSAGTSPDVRRQRQLITAGEGELTSAIRSHVTSLDYRSVALEELTSRISSELAVLPTQMAEEARLGQMVETYRKMSDQLREDYQNARMAEGVAEGQADIIDLASLPYRPVSRLRTVKLGLGLAVGLMFGGGAALFLDLRTQSVRRRDEIESLFELPLLGVIPRASAPDVGTLRRRPDVKKLLNPSVRKRLFVQRSAKSGAENGSGDDESLYWVEHATHAGEAYRMLRTNLLFTGWSDDIRTVVVTSSAPKEGKTLTAANLAACIAEEGRRVLLIDGDLWRGRIHNMIGVAQAPGFADLLGEEGGGKGTIHRTGVHGLRFLARGTKHPNPSSLTRGKRLRALLEQLSENFDVVVIDAPPVLAAATAPVLAAVADGVLFVVRAGQTDRRAVTEALKELGTVDARILGIVFNDPNNSDISRERRHSYYEYAGD